jgi:hypothetical protein
MTVRVEPGPTMPVGDNGHRGLAGRRRLAVDALGYAVALALAGVAAVRGGKAVHPHGAVYGAQLVVPGDGDSLRHTELFGTPGRRPALVRFSRSLGLPRPLPDLLGMSVRVPDAYGPCRHQDFLMVTSIDAPLMHHLFVPARDVQQRAPSSSTSPWPACGAASGRWQSSAWRIRSRPRQTRCDSIPGTPVAAWSRRER